MSDEPMLAGKSALWAQPDGPNTKPEYLGCHALGDITEPKGDVTTIYRPDKAQTGEFKAVGSYRGAPGAVTATLTADVRPTQDALEKVRGCKCTIFAHKQDCGRRDTFTNYRRSFVLENCIISSAGITGVAVADQNDETVTQQTFDLSAERLGRVLRLTVGRQTIGSTGDLVGIHFCNAVQCAGSCGPAKPVCSYGVACGSAPTASVTEHGEVWYTEDGGATWTECVADPFAADEDVGAVTCFLMGRNTTRIIAARGTTDAGNPAEIGYSDDDGATWTLVDVGSVNGQYVTDPRALFALDQYNVWLVTNDGYIYYSEDSGLTWTTQESGALTSDPLNCIQFLNEDDGFAVGDNNIILSTNDGGTTWTALTGPTGKATDEVEALAVVTENRVFIGFSDGELWYTENAGASWAQRTLPVALSIINDIAFLEENEYIGYLVGNTAAGAGVILRTIDGGYTWEQVSGLPTNAGLSAIHVCETNLAFAVGPVQGGTGVVLKAYAS